MDTEEMEKYIFDRYKYFVGKYIEFHKGCVSNYWEIIQEFQIILNTFFEYDFSHDNDHYMVIKNEKIIYEYDIGDD